MEDQLTTHDEHGVEEDLDLLDETAGAAGRNRRRPRSARLRVLPLAVGVGVLVLVGAWAFKAWLNSDSSEAASATPTTGAPTCAAKPAPPARSAHETGKKHKKKDRQPVARPKQTPCLALRVESSDGWKGVEVVGYIGLAPGHPLRGARIELLGRKVTSLVQPTGDALVSDEHGTVRFTQKSPAHAYALRFDENNFYGAAASPVVDVPN